jgi:hypothetical protein
VGTDYGDCGECAIIPYLDFIKSSKNTPQYFRNFHYFYKKKFKMTSKNLFLLLLIAQFTNLFAQDPMVAYRKEGIWYYFDTNGKSMWEPYADVAAFPGGWNKGLLKASAMEITGKDATDIGVVRQQVLYDNKGKIVVRPKIKGFYRIVSNADKAGFIHIISNENEHIILCDKAGNVVYESHNSTAQYMGDGVVTYLKTDEELIADGDKNYILFDVKKKKEMATITCSGIRGDFKNGSVFCYNAAYNWGMLNRQGQLSKPMIWEGDLFEEEEKPQPLDFGFLALKSPKTSLLSLINKNGDVVLTKINEIVSFSKDYFQCRFKTEDYRTWHTYVLEGAKVTEIDLKNGENFVATEGDILLRKDAQNNLTITDKTLKPIAKIKSFKYSALEVFEHHIWTQTDTTNEFAFTCYNEKGIKTGTIEAEEWGKSAYGHVPFMKGGLWGLATESGKVVIKPTFTFKEGNIPDVNKGYWCIPKPISDDNVQFDFYNFQGKLVMSTTAEKDGWDYIVQQEEVEIYRNN